MDFSCIWGFMDEERIMVVRKVDVGKESSL